MSTSAGTYSTGPTTFRQELMLCQGCWKTQGALNIIFKQCDRCKNAMYCSRECQRAAWPNHKFHCNCVAQSKQRLKDLESDSNVAAFEDLNKWVSKHHPTLAHSTIDCLDVHNQPKSHETHFMMMMVTYKPDSPNIQTRFRVERAESATHAALLSVPNKSIHHEELLSMFEQRRLIELELKRQGMIGTAMCAVICVNEGTIVCLDLFLVSIGEGTFTRPRDPDWNIKLKMRAELGIIF